MKIKRQLIPPTMTVGEAVRRGLIIPSNQPPTHKLVGKRVRKLK
jgi:hypothetical protein